MYADWRNAFTSGTSEGQSIKFYLYLQALDIEKSIKT